MNFDQWLAVAAISIPMAINTVGMLFTIWLTFRTHKAVNSTATILANSALVNEAERIDLTKKLAVSETKRKHPQSPLDPPS